MLIVNINLLQDIFLDQSNWIFLDKKGVILGKSGHVLKLFYHAMDSCDEVASECYTIGVIYQTVILFPINLKKNYKLPIRITFVRFGPSIDVLSFY